MGRVAVAKSGTGSLVEGETTKTKRGGEEVGKRWGAGVGGVGRRVPKKRREVGSGSRGRAKSGESAAGLIAACKLGLQPFGPAFDFTACICRLQTLNPAIVLIAGNQT